LEKYGMQQSALPYGSSASESGDKQKKADDEGALCVDELAKSSNWQIEPSVGRVANGVSFRMDRIKALGNSVVPQQVEKAFEMLIGLS
jgi:DNA (cytosine-5)-methyltransferase 1